MQMGILPVPEPSQDEERYTATAQTWEQAAPDYDGPQLGYGGGPVTMSRTGPGDDPTSNDQWMGISIWDVGHNNIQNGRGNFVEIPGPPPEGHQGYDLADEDLIINRSTSRQALFYSDWEAATAANATGGGSFRGEHVTIARITPGSVLGYMPSDPGIVQANNSRNLPPPWDANIIVPNVPLAATSQ
jgi:hypothetical protein